MMYFFLALFMIWSCGGTKNINQKAPKTEAVVRIANDTLQYEITIIDNGFLTYLNTVARPMNYYSVTYLESKNHYYVTEWNNRVRSNYKPNLYENIIDYDYNIHYGLEVNYKLYNYFKFVESQYGERF